MQIFSIFCRFLYFFCCFFIKKQTPRHRRGPFTFPTAIVEEGVTLGSGDKDGYMKLFINRYKAAYRPLQKVTKVTKLHILRGVAPPTKSIHPPKGHTRAAIPARKKSEE